ncbi:SMI1/KNR4 family protein [Clostridium butyricum]|uniref:SMI1/KNR4 family protein n=1 Tax=Clostridium butyricum TaxID=1492 RepID=UPI00374EDA5D
MNINDVVNKIKKDTNCIVSKEEGLPKLQNNHILPDDLTKFYQLCGGISLFKGSEYEMNILPPGKFLLANPIIVGELCEDDISSEWYTICEDSDGNFITIDLNKNRIGKCYDSFWDRHGVVGECSIIANSFLELLDKLYKNKGTSLFWLDDDFKYIGDAYDE